MARLDRKLAENQPGSFFVDDTCIDCDTCRQIAPDVFGRSDRSDKSFVSRQPASATELLRARMALVSCPTTSIGSLDKSDTRHAVSAFPERIEDEVYYCGFTSEASFGASSYLIRRDEGNVLVDSPRAARPLAARMSAMGGVATMFLTHRDDVADHAEYHRRFGCRRILHREDSTARTRGLELLWEGEDPVSLASDLIMIPVPGHTRGSAALLYQERFLFTGDHLWGSDDGQRLEASRSVCWYSWPRQTTSVERLLDFRFEWVLPGHGPRFRAPSAVAMRVEIEKLVGRMRNR